ncbi:hypothetical protein [Streptomyces sp. NPDC021622]|uniref:hypothetical protein n=1 Tax=Streptomyces sp. NPDC021622 TaxID=3155013 RepID=UPI0033D199FC
MDHSLGIRSSYARIRQLAYLALAAADHLLEARSEVRDRLVLVRDLTSLGADDALATAELLVTEMRRQRLLPADQLLDLSPAQHTALRAVVQGHVTIDRHDDKPRVSRDELRISISTIRSLEARGLGGREETPRILHGERVHLTADGCRTLAAGF